jgi:hypothetical protein
MRLPPASVTRPFVSVAIGDPRGLSGSTVFRWNGKPLALERRGHGDDAQARLVCAFRGEGLKA